MFYVNFNNYYMKMFLDIYNQNIYSIKCPRISQHHHILVFLTPPFTSVLHNCLKHTSRMFEDYKAYSDLSD